MGYPKGQQPNHVDKTYSLEHVVQPGETIAAIKMEQFGGGKGLNQAIALRRAGNEVFFAGAVGQDGQAQKALQVAATAAGIAVSRKGAEPSIPVMSEVEAVLRVSTEESGAVGE